ncbi:hypothetical protein NDN01_11230 [Sphingomonas sp. QA11]|uniref:hypothetical protein n=1 Tax=Sphingomonas sp. QA11 TaxID=2950605 RepID=UPI00234A82A4|nr:hypothetical protein [Sphingomonas sp. QA11]WCM29412.1 hypothetical protein NDN01_11230 [Sphingomonas sp. QA11]
MDRNALGYTQSIRWGNIVPQPLSIRLFALLFGFSVILSVTLALYTARSMAFGFPITPEASAILAGRILAIRMVGAAFALSLMLLVFFFKSRSARGTLVARWVLGVVTSVAFLRGIGIVDPVNDGGMATLAISLIQLTMEAFAILLLYGEDAADWFDMRVWR